MGALFACISAGLVGACCMGHFKARARERGKIKDEKRDSGLWTLDSGQKNETAREAQRRIREEAEKLERPGGFLYTGTRQAGTL